MLTYLHPSVFQADLIHNNDYNDYSSAINLITEQVFNNIRHLVSG